MRVLLNQIILELKLFFREPISVYWSFLFPALMMILVGWFFTYDEKKAVVYVYDKDKSDSSILVINQLKRAKDINIKVINTFDSFKQKTNYNHGELVLVVPKGFRNSFLKSRSEIVLYYNMVYGASNENVISLLHEHLLSINFNLLKKSPVIKLKKVNLANRKRKLSYIDFLYPGVIGMTIMSTCLFGIGILISSYREHGKLRRLSLTPLRKSIFIAGHIIERYIIVLLETIFLIIIAYLFFGIKIYGDILSLIIVLTVGLLTFSSIGFLIASRVKKAETAAVVANILFFPMMILGGVYFSVDRIPEVIRPLVYFIPLTHLTEALREVINYGVPFYHLSKQILAQLVVLVICFFISIKIFTWE